MKFRGDGTFVKAWGSTGSENGQFRSLHAIAIDSLGRVFVGDRANNRVQLFDQEGTHLASWTQFGRPSGIFFDTQGRILVADSESDDIENPGWDMGIRIGDAATGAVHEFILYPVGRPARARGHRRGVRRRRSRRQPLRRRAAAAPPAKVRTRAALSRAARAGLAAAREFLTLAATLGSFFPVASWGYARTHHPPRNPRLGRLPAERRAASRRRQSDGRQLLHRLPQRRRAHRRPLARAR